METRFNPVGDAAALEQLFERSHEKPVVLFKHSNTCPISARAYGQMEQFGGDVAIIVVQKNRDVSREIETRTGVRNESPQAFVLRNGQVAWSPSNFAITED